MQLFGRRFGSGPAVVILHGLFGMSDNWMSIGRALAGQGMAVHLLDLRNHGNSPHAATHRYPDMADDLLDYLDLQGLEQVALIGHSMGGKLAMIFTLLYPERLTKLVVVDIAPSAYPDLGQPAQICACLSGIDIAAYLTRGAVHNELAKRCGDPALAMFLAKSVTRNKEGALAWKFNLPVLHRYLRHLHCDLSELAIHAPSPVPTCFIRGEQSSYYLPEHEADRHFFFPDSSLVSIAAAGHWVHSDQPQLFLHQLGVFLGNGEDGERG